MERKHGVGILRVPLDCFFAVANGPLRIAVFARARLLCSIAEAILIKNCPLVISQVLEFSPFRCVAGAKPSFVNVVNRALRFEKLTREPREVLRADFKETS